MFTGFSPTCIWQKHLSVFCLRRIHFRSYFMWPQLFLKDWNVRHYKVVNSISFLLSHESREIFQPQKCYWLIQPPMVAISQWTFTVPMVLVSHQFINNQSNSHCWVCVCQFFFFFFFQQSFIINFLSWVALSNFE